MALLIKLLALASFLGGPLVLLDRYAPGANNTVAFLALISPCLAMAFAGLTFDEEDSRSKRWIVRLGELGAVALVLENAVALVLIARSHWVVVNAEMHLGAIVVGTFVAGWYLRESRRTRAPFDLQQALRRAALRSLIRDIALLVISLAFVVTGMFLLPHNFDVGITTLVFFGACGIVPVVSLARRYRTQKHEPQPVTLTADRTLRPARGRIAAIMFGVSLLGLVMVVFGTHFPPYMHWLLVALTAFCAVVAVLTLAGKLPAAYVRFDADALTIGRMRYALHVPWEQLGVVLVGEYFNNPVVMLEIEDLEAVRTTPPVRRDQALRALQRNRSFTGYPIMLMPTQLGLDAEPLAQTIELARMEAISPQRELPRP